MGFRCGNCHKTQDAKTKENKVVTQIRKVIYSPVKDNNGKITKIPEGYEIVKELSLCPKCSTLEFKLEIVDNKIIQ